MTETNDAPRSVRGVPDRVWRELRIEAVRQQRPLGELLTEAIEDALVVWHADPVVHDLATAYDAIFDVRDRAKKGDA